MRQTASGAADLSAPGDLASNAASFVGYLRAPNVQIIRKRGRHAGFGDGLHPHRLRHMWSTTRAGRSRALALLLGIRPIAGGQRRSSG